MDAAAIKTDAMLARQMALEMERAKFPVGGGAAGRRSSAPTLAHAEASERGAAAYATAGRSGGGVAAAAGASAGGRAPPREPHLQQQQQQQQQHHPQPVQQHASHAPAQVVPPQRYHAGQHDAARPRAPMSPRGGLPMSASPAGQSPQGSPKPTYQQPPPSAPGRDSLGETAKEIAAVADALRRQEKEDRDFHEALKKSREEADDYRLKQALRASETDVRREPTPTAAVDGFLAKHGYQKVNVASDGNCQFSALSLLLFGSVQDQAELRRYAVQELKQNPNKYATFVEGSTYDEYMRFVPLVSFFRKRSQSRQCNVGGSKLVASNELEHWMGWY
ncbi:hypothetical protein DIPPA_32638 [Diplonema papillatum]|nr:hypothetical protein DIPPA_32638 [Diplonema papillatum]